MPLVELLLQQPGINVNPSTEQPSHLGFTPMHWAVFQSNVPLAKCLAQSPGLDVNVQVSCFFSRFMGIVLTRNISRILQEYVGFPIYHCDLNRERLVV